MQNLLHETLNTLESHGKSPKDILWIGSEVHSWNAPTYTTCGSWEEFSRLADFEYDNGYGAAEINPNLLVVGADFWLERHEYDGSEWWEFKTIPSKPQNFEPLNPSSLTGRGL